VVNQPRTARDRIDRALAIGRRTRRFVWAALLVAVVGGLASFAYAMLRAPVYRSETAILCRGAIHPADVVGGAMLTRTRLEQIIKDQSLYGTLIDERGLDDAIEELRRHITLRVQDGDTFVLGFEGSDPERVQAVTAKLADALVTDSARAGDGGTDVSREILDREKDRMDSDLKAKDRALTQFLSKHPEFAHESQPRPPAPAAAAAKPAPKVDTTLAFLERETARLQERLDMPVTTRPKSEPQADPRLVAAKRDAEAELGKAQKELADKQGQFTDEHPDVRAARVRVKELQDKLKRAGDAVNASLAAQQRDNPAQEDEGYIDRGALENQLKRINDEIVELKRRKANASATAAPTPVATSVVALEMDWVRLNREAVEARERVQSMQEEQRKAAPAQSAAATAKRMQMVVIDPAFVPTHVSPPGRTTVLAAGLSATAVLALFVMLALALLDDRIYDRHDIERLGMLPLIGVVPRHGTDDKKVKLG
jgi:polysaccharide biosynthesis transport protein